MSPSTDLKNMSEIRYRLAKPSDAKDIANVHWHVRDRYTQGFFLSMGKGFLESYYKVLLNDPWEIVICAVNDDGKIVGFLSSSLNADARYKNIRAHKLSLGWAAAKAIICHPNLIPLVWNRYRMLGGNKDQFVKKDGVRVGYWCWLKTDDSLKSVELGQINWEILRAFGVKEYFFEVDKFNKAVYKYNLKIVKAEPVEEITLPDGRVRVLFRKKME